MQKSILFSLHNRILFFSSKQAKQFLFPILGIGLLFLFNACGSDSVIDKKDGGNQSDANDILIIDMIDLEPGDHRI